MTDTEKFKVKALQEALLNATAHLAAATSAYKTYAGNVNRQSVRDALYNMRLSDFERATELAQADCRKLCTK